MTVHRLVLSPSLTKLDFQVYCQELNRSYVMYRDDRLVLWRKGDNDVLAAFLTLREFLRHRSKLENSATPIVVFLPLRCLNVEVPVLEKSGLRAFSRMFERMMKTKVPVELPVKLVAESGESSRVALASMGNSVLNRTQTLLYRVPKPDRDLVQKAMYSYLAGHIENLGRIGEYGYLLTVLAEPHFVRLRNAAVEAVKITPAKAALKYNVDEYDINYLLHRTGVLGPRAEK